jgi:hypothetical protein
LDKHGQLWWPNPAQHIATPTEVVDLLVVDNNLLVLDINGKIWKNSDYENLDFSPHWDLLENFPCVRSWGFTPCGTLLFVTLDGDVWSYFSQDRLSNLTNVREIGKCSVQQSFVVLFQSGVLQEMLFCGWVETQNEDHPDELKGYTVREIHTPKIISFDCTHSHALVVDENHELWMWGQPGNDQFGNLSTVDPIKVSGPKNVIQCYASEFVSLAIASDAVWVFGSHKVETNVTGIFTTLQTNFSLETIRRVRCIITITLQYDCNCFLIHSDLIG